MKFPHHGVKECPFCGAVTPYLKITGPYEMDDRRFYRVDIQCENCDCSLVFDLGYRSYGEKGTESEAAEYMFVELFKKWNRRSGYKLEIEVT